MFRDLGGKFYTCRHKNPLNIQPNVEDILHGVLTSRNPSLKGGLLPETKLENSIDRKFQRNSRYKKTVTIRVNVTFEGLPSPVLKIKKTYDPTRNWVLTQSESYSSNSLTYLLYRTVSFSYFPFLSH